jgi:hypothetical protein
MLVTLVLLGCGAAEHGSTLDRERSFWRWFSRNAARIAMAPPREVLASEEVHRELRRVDADLDFDLPGGLVGGDRQFVVTAAGKLEAFPAVERLVAAAPPIPGWRILAFQRRAPRSDRLVITSRSYTLDLDRVLYASRPEGDRLAITLYLAGYERRTNELPAAALILLERLLGEVDLATQIGTIDFEPAAEAPPEARPLRLLPGEIDRRKDAASGIAPAPTGSYGLLPSRINGTARSTASVTPFELVFMSTPLSFTERRAVAYISRRVRSSSPHFAASQSASAFAAHS